MDLRQLRYFAQIVESGSLSKASRTLYVAQPALSQQISKLESELGCLLLLRSPTGVTPTEHGHALYHQARFMLRQMEQAMSIARRGSGAVQGMVSVGLPATTVAALGLSLVLRVRERYPGILLNVVEAMSGHLSQMMRVGSLDLAILFANDVTHDASIEPLLEEELFVFLSESESLFPRERTTMTLAEAAALPMIVPTSEHGLRRRISAEFEHRNMSLQIVAEIDSLSLVMNCVSAEIGATIQPMAALSLEGMRGRRFRALSISDARMTRLSHLYSLPPIRLTAAASAVAMELRQTVRELVASGLWEGVKPMEAGGVVAPAKPFARPAIKMQGVSRAPRQRKHATATDSKRTR